jgi:hypothetical protein
VVGHLKIQKILRSSVPNAEIALTSVIVKPLKKRISCIKTKEVNIIGSIATI